MKGVVPASTTQARLGYLRGEGTWNLPVGTTYDVASTTAKGLMSAADKLKADRTAIIGVWGKGNLSGGPSYGAATITLYRCGGNYGLCSITVSSMTVSSTIASNNLVFKAYVANGVTPSGDFYFKPVISNSGANVSTALYASAGSASGFVEVYAMGSLSAATYSLSVVVPVLFS